MSEDAALRGVAPLALLSAFALIALQPVLAARLRILDRLFGLDRVYLLHKAVGMTAAAALVAASLLLALRGGRPLLSGMVIPGAASLLVIVLVITALAHRELRLAYERWRRLHNALALSLLALVFALGLLVSDTGALPSRAAWISLLLVAAWFYVAHKLVGPLRRRRRPFVVEEVRRETENVWTLRLRPPRGERRFDFRPGQFQFLTFLSPQLPGEEHPFTIASSPAADGWHESTIKESGDFTSRIGEVQKGDRIAVQAPFGRFSYSLHPDERDLVLVAGGIGITPFMSMLRHMRDAREAPSAVLLYANQSERDIVFEKELDALVSGPRSRLREVVHVLARPGESWSGERGHVDGDLIRRRVEGRLEEKSFYVCGPPPMMKSVIGDLVRLGVPSSRVRSERFAL